MRESSFEAAVAGVPAGLIACRLNGRGVHLVRLAPSALWLRLAENEAPVGRLDLYFRSLSGETENIVISEYQTDAAHCGDCSALHRFSFENAAYQRAFYRTLDVYAAYIRAFSEGDFPIFTRDGTEDEAILLAEALDFSFLQLPDAKEICLSLHEPELWTLYLGNSIEDFCRLYAEKKRISPLKRIDRIYLGNAFCRQLFPDGEYLKSIIARAERDRLPVTLVTSPDPRLDDALLKNYRGEMLVNDWGLLWRLQSHPQIQPLFGTLLNKRRKDPRLPWKMDLQKELLRENALSSEEFRSFLSELGVKRWEFERCAYDYALPKGKCSLHLPYYQINTSVYCPLRALCTQGDRGAQAEDEGCLRYCRNNRTAYPQDMKTVARWNSLFGFDDRPADDFDGFDRLVLNL